MTLVWWGFTTADGHCDWPRSFSPSSCSLVMSCSKAATPSCSSPWIRPVATSVCICWNRSMIKYNVLGCQHCSFDRLIVSDLDVQRTCGCHSFNEDAEKRSSRVRQQAVFIVLHKYRTTQHSAINIDPLWWKYPPSNGAIIVQCDLVQALYFLFLVQAIPWFRLSDFRFIKITWRQPTAYKTNRYRRNTWGPFCYSHNSLTYVI